MNLVAFIKNLATCLAEIKVEVIKTAQFCTEESQG